MAAHQLFAAHGGRNGHFDFRAAEQVDDKECLALFGAVGKNTTALLIIITS